MLPSFYDHLRDRVDRVAAFIEELKRRGFAFPICVVGFSLGGLVARGYLRAYPQRASDVAAVVTIATPHVGMETKTFPQIARLLRVPDRALGDLAHESDFLEWLNGTRGRWRENSQGRRWQLDTEPWVGTDRTSIQAVAGLVPTEPLSAAGDGVVSGYSASLASQLPTQYVIGRHCHHMNLIRHFDPFIFLWTRSTINDLVWPHTVRAVTRACGATAAATAKG